jgi:hypothetical protein
MLVAGVDGCRAGWVAFKDAIRAAISEMQHGLGRIGLSVFYVEAIVGADNKTSQGVAEQVISHH